MTIWRRRHVKAHGRWNQADRQIIIEPAISYGKTMLKCRFHPGYMTERARAEGPQSICGPNRPIGGERDGFRTQLYV